MQKWPNRSRDVNLHKVQVSALISHFGWLVGWLAGWLVGWFIPALSSTQKTKPTRGSKTSIYNHNTLGNNPKTRIYHCDHGKSLNSQLNSRLLTCWVNRHVANDRKSTTYKHKKERAIKSHQHKQKITCTFMRTPYDTKTKEVSNLTVTASWTYKNHYTLNSPQ